MTSLALVLAVQIAAPLQVGANEDVAAVPAEPPVSCFADDQADLAAVAKVLGALPGGRWWIPRFDADGTLVVSASSGFSVVDGGGEEVLISDVHTSPAAVSLDVPDGLSPGTVLQLAVDGSVVSGVVLRVVAGDPPSATAVLEDVVVTGTAPEACDVICSFEGMTVPAAPLLTFTYTGGPFILDGWAAVEGSVLEDATPRVVDSQLLPAVTEPTSVSVRLNEVGFSTGLDVRARALNPDSLVVLHDESLAVAPVGERPVEELGEDIAPCNTNVNPTPAPFGCFGAAPMETATLFGALFLLGLRRRRRSR